MRISYHNHTRWSDGACTIEEQIAEAERLGLDELGLSDHLVLYPGDEPVEWSLPPARLGAYVASVRAAAEAASIPVRLGIEADYFPETINTLRETLAQHPFDYVIGSTHYVDGFPLDENAKLWNALSEDEINAKWRLYWRRTREMAESRVFDFAAHLDLPKKFGHRPTVDLLKESSAALDAIAASDMAIEINTAGWSLPAQEAYPTLALLQAARARDIPLLINADAHSPAHLMRNFERARALAHEAGYSELARYVQRERFFYLLGDLA